MLVFIHLIMYALCIVLRRMLSTGRMLAATPAPSEYKSMF